MTEQELSHLENYVADVVGMRGTFTAARLRLIASIADKLAKEARTLADAKEAAINALNQCR